MVGNEDVLVDDIFRGFVFIVIKFFEYNFIYFLEWLSLKGKFFIDL